MSKTTRNVQIAKGETRKQLSRAEREARQSRRVRLVVGGVIGLMVLIVGFGILRQNVFLLNEPVANVNGETISTAQFQARVRLARLQLRQAVDNANQVGDTQSVQRYQQELDNPNSLGSSILSTMIDELLLKQGAKDFNVSVSPDEVQKFIEEDFGYQRNPPTPAPTNTPRPTPTVTEPITQTPTPTITPFPTATPVTQEGFQKLFGDQLSVLSSLGMSEQEYRNTIELRLLGQKVRAAIDSTVPTTTEQIRFEYIRIDTPSLLTVTQVISRDGFDKVYQAIISGTFPITTVEAPGPTGWVPMDEISQTTEFGPAIAQALFATPISQTTAIIANQSGTASYISKILDKGIQPLSPSFLQPRQQQAEEAWLEQRRNPAFILTWEDRVPTTP